MRRREALGAAVALGTGTLAGCLFAGSGAGCSMELPAEGFVISNGDDTAHTLSVSVIRELVVHTEEVFSDSYELAPEGEGSSLEVPDVVSIAGPHVLKLELENGSTTTYLWKVTTDRCDALRITVEDGAVSVSEAGDL